MNVVTKTEAYETSLQLISKPSFGYQGIIPDKAIKFKVVISDPEYEKYTLTVYADGSRSLPYTEDSTTIWSHLKPRWRFLDRALSPFDYEANIKIVTKIVDSNGITTGAIGEVDVYYVDDLPTTYVVDDTGTEVVTNIPVLLWFSIGDRANSTIKTVLSYIVKPLKPELLKVTHDGSTRMLDLYNAGNPISTYFTIHTDYNGQQPIIYDIPNSYNPFVNPSYTSKVTYYLDGRGTNNIPPVQPYPYYLEADLPYFQIGVKVEGGFTSSTEIIPDFTHRQNRIVATTDVTINEAVYEIADLQISNIIVNNPRHNKFHIFDSYAIDENLEANEYKYLDVSMDSNTIEVPIRFTINNWNDVKNGIDYSANPMEMLNYSGGYGTAIDGNDAIWVADFELDVIYKYTSSGTQISLNNGHLYDHIDLRDIPIDIPYKSDTGDTQYTWFGPNDITVDKDNNIYVSLYTSPYVVKFTSEGVYLGLTEPNDYNDTITVNDYDDELVIRKVTSVEALDDDIIAIAYAGLSTGSCYFSVFNGTNESNRIVFNDLNSQITNIIPSIEDTINLNKFYITVSSDVVGGEGGVYEVIYNGTNTIVATRIPAIALTDISHFTIDSNKSIWVCHGYNNVSVFKLDTGVYTQFGDAMVVETSDATRNGNIILNPDYDEVHDPIDEKYMLRYKGVNIFGGISYDLSGWITILQSFDNVIVRTDVRNFMETTETDKSEYLLYFAEGSTNFDTWIVSDFSSQPAYITTTAPFKSIQANGDWSGAYWGYKYGSINVEIPENEYVDINLNTESSIFAITTVNGDDLLLTRQGETISMIDQLKSYVLQEPLSQYTTLWDDLMFNIVGDEDSNYQTFGKQFYEKITNFVQNHADIDTANVRQFYSTNKMLGNSVIDYDYNYPPDVSRLMDIVSVQYSRLVGNRRTCNRNYSQDRRYTLTDQVETYENISFKDVRCPNCGAKHPSNLGLLIHNDGSSSAPDADAYVEYTGSSYLVFGTVDNHVLYTDPFNGYLMQEGVPIVIRDTYTTSKREYSIFYPTSDMDGEPFTYLDTINVGFRQPFAENYQAYDYIDLTSKTIQDDGVLSLDSDNTDQAILDINNIDDWFESGGKVEALFATTLSNILGVDGITSEDVLEVLSASLMTSAIDVTSLVLDGVKLSSIVNVPMVVMGSNNTYLKLYDYFDDTLTDDVKILELGSYNSTAIIDTVTKYLKVYIYGVPFYIEIETVNNTFIGSSSVIDAIFENATIADDSVIMTSIDKVISVRFNNNIYYMPLYLGND